MVGSAVLISSGYNRTGNMVLIQSDVQNKCTYQIGFAMTKWGPKISSPLYSPQNSIFFLELTNLDLWNIDSASLLWKRPIQYDHVSGLTPLRNWFNKQKSIMGDYDGNSDYCSFLRETSLRDVKLAKPLNYSEYPTVPLGLVSVGNGTCVWEGCKRSVVRGKLLD